MPLMAMSFVFLVGQLSSGVFFHNLYPEERSVMGDFRVLAELVER